MKKGEKKRAEVKSDDAFGPRIDEEYYSMKKSQFPGMSAHSLNRSSQDPVSL